MPALRSLALGGLWLASGQRGPGWVVGLPWLLGLWQNSGQIWPGLVHQPEWRLGGWLLWQGQRLALLGSLGLVVSQELLGRGEGGLAGGRLELCDLWPGGAVGAGGTRQGWKLPRRTVRTL